MPPMSEESVAIAALDRRLTKAEDGLEPVASLLASKHTHGNKLQEHASKLDILETKVATTMTDLAVVQSTVSTGFSDLKDVIIVRAEAEAEARVREHELAIAAQANHRALAAKVLGLLATALTILGGSGGAYYVMADKAEPSVHVAPHPGPVASPPEP